MISPYVRPPAAIVKDSDLTEQHLMVLLGIRDGATIRGIALTMGRSRTWVLWLLEKLHDYGAFEVDDTGRKRRLTPKGRELLWQRMFLKM